MTDDEARARADRILHNRRVRVKVLETQLGRDLTSNQWVEWVARQLCTSTHLDPDLGLLGVVKGRTVPQWFVMAPVAKRLLQKIEDKLNGTQ